MKTVRTGILAAALLLTIGVTGAFAAGPGWGRHAGWNSSCPAAGASCRYDTDGDGICDACGVTCVAEGIENTDQAAALAEMGCQYGQGYYYDRPMPAQQFEQKYLRPAET